MANGGSNKALTASANKLVYSDSDSFELLDTGNSGVLVTSGAGAPSIATDIPTAVTIGTKYVYRAEGTDVPVTDGGTGASDAGTARSNLGIGTIAVLASPLPQANGGLPATQRLWLNPSEFAPSPDGAANSVVITVAYDRTNYRSYFQIDSGSATQDYDMVIIVKLPTDFVSFSANALSLDVYTVDYANSAITVTVYKNDNTTDVSASSVIATADLAYQTKLVAPATTGYAAGDNVKILIHVQTGNAASEYVRVGRIFLTYTTR